MQGARSRNRALLLSTAALAASLAGCGNSRTPAPSLTAPAAPTAFRTLSFPSRGLRLRAPTNWSIGGGKGPLVATISSGTAVIAVWRYRRSAPPPSGAAALSRARQKLIKLARSRYPQIRVIRTKITMIDGAAAIELDTLEKVGGQPRRVRSTHVFERRAEFVLEEYAPAQLFHGVDHSVFSPVKRSLVLSASA